MQVAVVGPTHPFKGGVAIHTTLLARRLTAAGHTVALASWSEQYPERLYPGQQRVSDPEVVPYPATTYPLSWRRPVSWWATGRRLGAANELLVVVVVATVQVPAWLAVIAAARRANPMLRVVALCHNVLPHERRRGDRALMRALLGRVDAVLTHTADQEAVARTLTDRPVTTAVLPPLVDASPVRSEAGTELLFFGLVRPYKGLDVLLQAMARTSGGRRLVVAGEFWGGVAPTQALIAELGITDRVELLAGYRPASELPTLFGRAAAVVLPYREATSSAVLTLAREYGVPAVATRVGSLAHDVTDGVDGLLVQPEDPVDLAAALDRLDDPAVLASLRAGVAPIPYDLTWDAYVDVLERAADQEGVVMTTPDGGERKAQLAYSELMTLMSDEPHRRAKARKIVGVLRHYLGRPDLSGLTVLDLGCSAGIIASELAAHGARTIGIDIDAPGLARAQRDHGRGVRFLAADGEHLPFPDGAIDVVVLNHIYEHVVSAEPVVAEIARVLAPHGCAYLGLGNRLGIMEPHYRLPFLSYLPPALADRYVRASGRAASYHERFRTRRGLRRLFAVLTCWDYSLAVVREPGRFAAEDVVHGWLGASLGAAPPALLRAVLPVFPTYVWVAGRDDLGPRGEDLATPVTRVT